VLKTRPADRTGGPSIIRLMVRRAQTPSPADNAPVPDASQAHNQANGNNESGQRITGSDGAVVAVMALILLIVTYPRLPSGVCFGDSGGLQLASATLGITHPPGYGVLASLLHPFTLLPGLEPARAVTVGCLLAGIGVIVLATLVQIRLGVPALLAGAIGLALTAQPQIWTNLLAPEVYAPTLFLLAAGVYLAMRFERIHHRRYLLIGALCFGAALAIRPPVLLMTPFFLIALLVGLRGCETSRRKRAAWVAAAMGVAVLPGVYGLGYLWVRDTPETPFNYIEHYNAEANVLPDTTAGRGAKWRRVVWMAGGEQFRDNVQISWPTLSQKLTRWLPTQFASHRIIDALFGNYPYWRATLAVVIAGVAAIVGMALTFRRTAMTAWLLVGMAVGSLGYIGIYQEIGGAADLLPLLFVATVGLGVAVNEAMRRIGARAKTGACGLLFVIAVGYTVVDAPDRADAGRRVDASVFLAELDLESLPPHTIICSTWHHSPALWYEQLVRADRDDLTIINGGVNAWPRMVATVLRDRRQSSGERGGDSDVASEAGPLILTTIRPTDWENRHATPYRHVWRVRAVADR